jgi:hypothetical protein
MNPAAEAPCADELDVSVPDVHASAPANRISQNEAPANSSRPNEPVQSQPLPLALTETWMEREGTTRDDYPGDFEFWEKVLSEEVKLSHSQTHFVLKRWVTNGWIKDKVAPTPPTPVRSTRTRGHLTMAQKVLMLGLPVRPFADDINAPLHDKSYGINPPAERAQAHVSAQLRCVVGFTVCGADLDSYFLGRRGDYGGN